MAANNKYKMSQERLDKLVEELKYLETDRAKEVAEQLKEARSFGDLSENSEYDEAKAEREKLYNKIAEVKDLIDNAEIVEYTDTVNANALAVMMGSKVKVRDIEFDEDEEFEIVGSQEADPMSGKISDDSPFGRALYGHVAGDTVKVEAPDGNIMFEILFVEND